MVVANAACRHGGMQAEATFTCDLKSGAANAPPSLLTSWSIITATITRRHRRHLHFRFAGPVAVAVYTTTNYSGGRSNCSNSTSRCGNRERTPPILFASRLRSLVPRPRLSCSDATNSTFHTSNARRRRHSLLVALPAVQRAASLRAECGRQ